MNMSPEKLIQRIVVDPNIAGGKPVIRGTRVYVSLILGGLSEGMTSEEIIDHYPNISIDDIRAALAYGAVLAEENTFKIAV
jgi:uncharacterized protein (DUF433 family)